ncbi:MAG: T9SS type A sorting domain-containing protein [Ignavibacteria bacterium]|nr:T9SS type A sorting domain-containing protein [Ignavibacteria bacterium]
MIFINSGAVILAVSGKVLYASTDRGFTWAVRDSLAEIITAVDADPDNESIVYAGTSKGLYRSADSGYTFQLFNNAFSPSRKVIFLCKQPGANYVYAVTEEAVYKCWFSFLVNTNENSEALPLSFKLHQNYPNPFNPVTTITYDLPNSGFVTLKVYDMLGRQVKTLVNEMKTAGFHEAQFSAEKLPSGAYFYRLSVSSNAGEFVAVRKCIILK